MCYYEAFYTMVKDWTVSDYRTPKIKAEVIVDMLISEFIEEIVAYGVYGKNESNKKLKLIAKEFPISRVEHDKLSPETIKIIKKYKDYKSGERPKLKDIGNLGNRQYASVEYLLKDEAGSTVYLVELKSTNDSVSGTQLLNMIKTCENGIQSLYYRFYDVVMNYCIVDKPNELESKKYLHLLKMNDDEYDKKEIKAFGKERQNNKVLMDKQLDMAERIFANKFPDKWKDNDKAEIKIVYLSLQKIENDEIIKEAKSEKKKIEEGKDKKKKEAMAKAKIDIEEAQRSYLCAPVILKGIVNNLVFTNMLESDKRAKWKKVKYILKELLIDKNYWFWRKVMSVEKFDADMEKLYYLLRDTPKAKLPGLGNCPEYQELYDSALENGPDEYIWFTEKADIVVYYLAGSEDSNARFAGCNIDDIPGLIMEEILTGKARLSDS